MNGAIAPKPSVLTHREEAATWFQMASDNVLINPGFRKATADYVARGQECLAQAEREERR